MSIPWYLDRLDPTVYLDESRWLVLDFETSNLEFGTALNKDNWPVLACHQTCLGDSLVERTEPGNLSKAFPELRERIKAASVLVAHNAKFELQWLARLGIDTSHLLVMDTLIAEYCIAGNRRWTLDLDSVGTRYGIGSKDPVVASLMAGGVCPSEMPRERLIARVSRDVATTYQLAQRQLVVLQELGLLPVFFTRCLATPVLAEMETYGMALDPSIVRQEYDATVTEIAAVERDLGDLAGGRNLRSPKQMAQLLYDVLGFEELKDRKGNPKRNAPTKLQIKKGDLEGARKTDADTLEALKPKTADQRRFVAARKKWGLLNARITKSLEFFKHVCDERGGVFYGQIHQTRTQTHRMASSGRRVTFSDGFTGGAQFQNLANDLKKCFTSRGPGTVLVESDGAGIEFRVAGELCGDTQAAADVVSGADVHRYTASVIHGIPEAKVTKDQRRLAKPDTFGPLYGKTSGTKGQVAYFKAFKAKYHQIADEQASWVTQVLATRELVTASGLRFYWPHCSMRADGYVGDSTQILNYPIQSFATADIVPIALVYIHWRAKADGLRAKLINTVHDSCIAEVHVDDVDAYKAIAVTGFLDDVYAYLEKVYKFDFSQIPLGVGFNVATHWGTGEETKVSYAKGDRPVEESTPW